MKASKFNFIYFYLAGVKRSRTRIEGVRNETVRITTNANLTQNFEFVIYSIKFFLLSMFIKCEDFYN